MSSEPLDAQSVTSAPSESHHSRISACERFMNVFFGGMIARRKAVKVEKSIQLLRKELMIRQGKLDTESSKLSEMKMKLHAILARRFDIVNSIARGQTTTTTQSNLNPEDLKRMSVDLNRRIIRQKNAVNKLRFSVSTLESDLHTADERLMMMREAEQENLVGRLFAAISPSLDEIEDLHEKRLDRVQNQTEISQVAASHAQELERATDPELVNGMYDEDSVDADPLEAYMSNLKEEQIARQVVQMPMSHSTPIPTNTESTTTTQPSFDALRSDSVHVQIGVSEDEGDILNMT